MPQVLVTDTHLTAIGDAIRYKNGSQETYTPSEMAPAIRAITGIPTGYIQPSGTLQITSNGTYDVRQYAAAQVTFNAPTVAAGHVVEDANGIVIFSAESGLVGQTKTVNPSTTAQTITPDNGYDKLDSVTITAINLDTATVTPSASQQVITAGQGYNGLSQVTVNAIPNTYIPASSVVTYHTSSSAPTSTDGSNGDIWLQTSS